MVPLNWAFFNAEVNAGTASAARIAIIAITTNNSIRVNAEEVLFILFIFIGVCLGWRGLSHCSQIKSILIFLTFFGPRSDGLPATAGRLRIARMGDGWKL